MIIALARGASPWSRIASYGPAFFMKFLYLTVAGALILDARLASRLARLTGNGYGYLRNGRRGLRTGTRSTCTG